MEKIGGAMASSSNLESNIPNTDNLNSEDFLLTDRDKDPSNSANTSTAVELQTREAMDMGTENTQPESGDSMDKRESSENAEDGDLERNVLPVCTNPIIMVDKGKREIFSSHLPARESYCAREERLIKEEEAGRLEFACLKNDGDLEKMKLLIDLKEVYAKRLLIVDRTVLVRIIMDGIHKSILVVKQNKVIGGVTYRPFASQNFGEIALLAISGPETIQGYGTRLMNHLKERARDEDGLDYLLAYADLGAIRFFEKQGFTEKISLKREIWQGYLKYYDDAILMECKIFPYSYTNLPRELPILKQRLLEKQLKQYPNSKSHIIYPGINIEKDEAGIPREPLKPENIPGLKEAGWTHDQYGHSRFKVAGASANSQAHLKAITAFMRTLVKSMRDHPDAWPFLEPVDARDVPDYYEIIKDPIDLQTISKRVESEKYYVTLEMFIADVHRIFINAKRFNDDHTEYFKCAARLEAFFLEIFYSGVQYI